MRILVLCYEFPPLGGGGGQFAHGLSRALVGRGHAVDLVTMAFRGLPRSEIVDGISVHRVPCVRLKRFHCTLPEAATYLAASPLFVRRRLDATAYDLVHAHFILPDGLTAWRLRRATGLPYVITAHGSDVPGYNTHRLKRTHELLGPIWRAVVRDAARVVCPSHSLAALLALRTPELEPALLPYGFDAARYSCAPERRKRVLVVTRAVERKGVQHLLEAVRGIRLDHEIHIVGDGPYLSRLRKMAEATPTPVVFHGWLDNRSAVLRRLYESSRIFVMTSEAENFPVSLLEAMSAGLAVVTSRGTGCEEVTGETALLVTPGDVGELRSALLRLTAEPETCRRLGEAARARVEREFAWSRIVAGYEELYRTHRRPSPGPRAAPAGAGI